MAPRFGFAPALEARFARRALDCEHVAVSLQRLAPGRSAPFAHRHSAASEEIYVVVAGSGRIRVGDELRELRPWDAVRVAGEAVRSFEAGPEGLELVAFGPTGLDDVELLPVGG